MWWLMVFIYIKQHLIWKRQQCVHIYHHIMHYYTGNMCCVLVLTPHVLISQANNHISIIKAHVLRYVFMFITLLHGIQYMEDYHWTKRKLLLMFAWSFFCATRITLHKKRYCYYGNIYLLLPHKFIHSRNTKISVSPPTCTHYSYTSLWQHTPWNIEISLLIPRCFLLLWLFRESGSYFCTPNSIRILWRQLICVHWRNCIGSI